MHMHMFLSGQAASPVYAYICMQAASAAAAEATKLQATTMERLAGVRGDKQRVEARLVLATREVQTRQQEVQTSQHALQVRVGRSRQW